MSKRSVKEKSDRELLNAFVWGDEPKDIRQIEQELQVRGCDIDQVLSEIKDLINSFIIQYFSRKNGEREENDPD